MPIILAIEPDRRQAAHLAGVVRQRVQAELILSDTTEGALDAIGDRVPDMVLVPALLSPQDDAALAAALRVIAAAAHVRTLTIPVLANGTGRTKPGGMLAKWRRGRAESPALEGCDPSVFAEQINAYLREAAAERAALEPALADEPEIEDVPDAELSEQLEAFDLLPAIPEPAPVPQPDAASMAASRVEELFVEPTQIETVDIDEYVFLIDASAVSDHLADAFAFQPLVVSAPGAAELVVDDHAGPEALLAEAPAVAELIVEESLVEAPVVEEPLVEPLIVEDMPAEAETPRTDIEPWVPVHLTPRRMWPPLEGVFAQALTPEELHSRSQPESIAAFVQVEMDPVVTQPKPLAEARAEEPLQPRPEPRPEAGPAAATRRADHPEWLELVASLRHDIERRRSAPPPVPAIVRTPVRTPAPAPPVAAGPLNGGDGKGHHRIKKQRTFGKMPTPLQDEWGLFDPKQCGFSALLAKLEEITGPPDEADAR